MKPVRPQNIAVIFVAAGATLQAALPPIGSPQGTSTSSKDYVGYARTYSIVDSLLVMKSGGEERLEARTKLPELREPEAPVDLMYLGSSSDQDALDHAMGVNPFAGATTSSGKGLSPEDSGDEALTILLPKQLDMSAEQFVAYSRRLRHSVELDGDAERAEVEHILSENRKERKLYKQRKALLPDDAVVTMSDLGFRGYIKSLRDKSHKAAGRTDTAGLAELDATISRARAVRAEQNELRRSSEPRNASNPNDMDPVLTRSKGVGRKWRRDISSERWDRLSLNEIRAYMETLVNRRRKARASGRVEDAESADELLERFRAHASSRGIKLRPKRRVVPSSGKAAISSGPNAARSSSRRDSAPPTGSSQGQLQRALPSDSRPERTSSMQQYHGSTSTPIPWEGSASDSLKSPTRELEQLGYDEGSWERFNS